jgi:hypothetical protein
MARKKLIEEREKVLVAELLAEEEAQGLTAKEENIKMTSRKRWLHPQIQVEESAVFLPARQKLPQPLHCEPH